jgi:type IV secretion system protein VirD4
VLVIQTPAQLRDVYGPNGAETMLKSLAARIVFEPKDFADAREISDELGFTTVKAATLSKPLLGFSDARGRRQRSVSVSEQRRALLLPQEVKTLGPEQAIIFCEGLRPIRCRKIRYFSDLRFKARLFPPPLREAPPAAPSVELTPAAIDAPTQPSHVTASPAESATPDAPVGGEVVDEVREATVEDIDRLESLTLEDFAVDFDKVQLPDREKMTEQELTAAVESFVTILREK